MLERRASVLHGTAINNWERLLCQKEKCPVTSGTMDAAKFYETMPPDDSIAALEELILDTAKLTQSHHVAVKRSRPMTVARYGWVIFSSSFRNA